MLATFEVAHDQKVVGALVLTLLDDGTIQVYASGKPKRDKLSARGMLFTATMTVSSQ